MGWRCVNISTCMGASAWKVTFFLEIHKWSKANWDINVNFLSSSHKANVNAHSKCPQKRIAPCFPGFRTSRFGLKSFQVWVQYFHLELTDDCVSLFGLDVGIQCMCTYQHLMGCGTAWKTEPGGSGSRSVWVHRETPIWKKKKNVIWWQTIETNSSHSKSKAGSNLLWLFGLVFTELELILFFFSFKILPDRNWIEMIPQAVYCLPPPPQGKADSSWATRKMLPVRLQQSSPAPVFLLPLREISVKNKHMRGHNDICLPACGSIRDPSVGCCCPDTSRQGNPVFIIENSSSSFIEKDICAS